jgi:hypothetical protein
MQHLIKNLTPSNIYLFLLAIFFFSCANKSKADLGSAKTLDYSLNKSNVFVTRQNSDLYEVIEKKLSDPSTSEITSHWQPKVLLIQKLSDQIFWDIDVLKQNLKQEAGLTVIDGKEVFKEDDLNAVSNLFRKKGKGEELKQQLLKYRNDIMSIDPEITSKFKERINMDIGLSNPSVDSTKLFTDVFFNNANPIMAFITLNVFRNNINILENELITFCVAKISE